MKSWGSLLRCMAITGILIVGGYSAVVSSTGHSGPKPDGRYDNNAYLVNPSRMALTQIAASIVTLVTKTTFVGPEGEMVEKEMEGSGVVIGRRYVLTVEHSVSQHGLQLVTPFGAVTLPAKKVSEKTFIRWQGKDHPVRTLYKNRADDVAFFELPPGLRVPTFPYAVGDSDDLQVGNYVYVVGNPLNLGINVREGIVSALRAPEEVSKIDAKGNNAFMVSNGVVPGDSGTPIIAIRDGRFELVGLTQGTFLQWGRLGWAIRINVIRSLLRTADSIPLNSRPLPKGIALAPSGGSPEAGSGGRFGQVGRRVGVILSDLFSLRFLRSPSRALRESTEIRNPLAREAGVAPRNFSTGRSS